LVTETGLWPKSEIPHLAQLHLLGKSESVISAYHCQPFKENGGIGPHVQMLCRRLTE